VERSYDSLKTLRLVGEKIQQRGESENSIDAAQSQLVVLDAFDEAAELERMPSHSEEGVIASLKRIPEERSAGWEKPLCTWGARKAGQSGHILDGPSKCAGLERVGTDRTSGDWKLWRFLPQFLRRGLKPTRAEFRNAGLNMCCS